ncbi:MAG: molecular chaperone DnaJ [bacterium]
MDHKRDYYEILNISRDSTGEEIKLSYRRLAIQYHPDKNPGDVEAEEKFKELSEAYSVLSDNDRRKVYDRFGHAGLSGNGGFSGGFDIGTSFADIFSDLFTDFFGTERSQRRSRGMRGEDLRYRLDITFEEAADGTEKEIKYPRLIECGRCLGDGIEPGHTPVMCTTCSGQGEIHFQQGFFTMARTCPHCGGRGRVIEDPCTACRGEARIQKEHTITVKVPAGVSDGNRLRLQGEGDGGLAGGGPGDLFVVVEVKSHPLFVREGNDIITEIPIRMELAAAGGVIDVPMLDGVVEFKIPPGTQSGQVFKFKGKGIKSLHGSRRGDQYVQVVVVIPSKLTRKQKDLLAEFEAESKSASYKPVNEFSRKLKKHPPEMTGKK